MPRCRPSIQLSGPAPRLFRLGGVNRDEALRAPVLERLEPRRLFSATVDAAAHGGFRGGPAGWAAAAIPSAIANRGSDSGIQGASLGVSDGVVSVRREMVFIDSGVDNPGQLLADLRSDSSDGIQLEVVVLNTNEDGVRQISAALRGVKDVAAVHIVSHGTDGGVRLGRSVLSTENFADYAHDLEGWRGALAAGADLLFYGCELAATETGRALMQRIGGACGCDVAASSDLTGHATLGGDWDLEYRTGSIETASAFSPALQASWLSTLASPTAVDDAYNADQNTTLNIGAGTGLLDNDTDPETNPLTVLDYTQPANGSVTVNPDGSFAYTPTPGYTGMDTFTYTIDDTEQDPAHYWGLNGDADAQVGGINGVVTNTTTIAGDFGTALEFDGLDNDKVTLSGITYNNEFSISLKFKAYTSSGGEYLYSHGSGWGATNSVHIMMPSSPTGYLRTNLRDSVEGSDQSSLDVDINSIVNDGLWHTYTLSVTASGSSVYIDGVLANTSSQGGAAFAPTGDAVLGQRSYSSENRAFEGALDSLQIHDEALDFAAASAFHAGPGAQQATVTLTVSAPNTDPTTSGITDVTVDEDALDSVVDLFAAFADAEDADSALAYTVTGNTNAGLFTSTAVDGVAGTLTLDYAPDANGVANLTVRATDTGGKFVETTFTVTVNAVNDDPTNAGTLPSDVVVTEDVSSSIDLSAIDLNDVDAGTQLVTVTLRTGAGGLLFAENYSDVTVLGSGTGVLQLTGEVSDINTFLDSPTQIQYLHGTLHTNGDDADTIQVESNDQGHAGTGGGGTVVFGSVNVDITAVNDAPVLDNGGVMTLTAITEDDTSNTGDLVSAIVASAGGDRITDVDAGAIEGVAITGLVSGGGTWQYDVGSGWTDVGSVSTSSALLLGATDRLRFVPDAQNADSGSVTFKAWDQTAGVAGTKVNASVGGGDTAFSTALESAAVVVTAINDAPTITNAFVVGLPGADEDSTTAGTTVSAIVNNAGWGDVDLGAVRGMAITASAGNGTWQYSTDGITWQGFGAVSGSNALLLDASSQVRYVGDGIDGEVPSFGFRGWDTTTGTASTNATPSYANPGAGGGTTAFSSGEASANATITAVNDEQVLAINAGATVSEGSTGNTISNLMLETTDVDNTDLQLVYTVTAAAGSGTLRLSGGALGLNDTFTQDDIDNSRVTYDHDGSEAPGDSFGFSVDDGAGSATAGTFSYMVTAVNDDPVADAGGPYVINEGAGVSLDGSGSSDPDLDPLIYAWDLDNDGQYDDASGLNPTVNWATLQGLGLASDGSALTIGVEVDDGQGGTDTATTTLTINNLPPSADAGGPYTINEGGALILNAGGSSDPGGDGLTYAWDLDNDGQYDDASGLNPTVPWATLQPLGLATDGTALTIGVEATDSDGATHTAGATLTLTNVAPTANDDGYGTNEDVALVVAAVAGVLVNDSDPADSLQAALLAGPAVGGVAPNTDGSFTYTPLPGWSGVDTFTYTAADGDGGTDTATVTITVNNVNDPPTVALANTTTALPEDTDTSTRVKVADIVITDDGTGTNGLSLAGADAGLFEIDGTELFLSAGAALDHETDITLNVTVQVDDTAVGATPDDTDALVLSITDVNEAPSVALINTTTTLPEDANTASRIKVADITVTDDALGTNALTLAGADAGLFEIDGTELYLSAGAALDHETNDTLDVTVRVDDAAVGSNPDDTDSLALGITDANEAPSLDVSLVDQGAAEDTPFAYTFASSSFSDPDAGDSLTYTAELAGGGGLPAWLSFVGATRTFAGTPAQADVATIDIRVIATDGGGLTADGVFELAVADVNDAPSITANNLAVSEGQSVILGTGNLDTADPDNAAADLTFSVTGLAGGRFEHVGSPGVAITGFAKTQLDAGQVRFVHDGGESAPSYTVSVSDGALSDGPSPAAIAFTNVNDAPRIVNNLLLIDAGQAVQLTSGQISASDPDHPAAQRSFNVSSVNHGQFELAGSPGVAVTAFTQAQVDGGQVVFVHDGSTDAPSYDLTVSDGTLSDGPSPAQVTFNLGPALAGLDLDPPVIAPPMGAPASDPPTPTGFEPGAGPTGGAPSTPPTGGSSLDLPTGASAPPPASDPPPSGADADGPAPPEPAPAETDHVPSDAPAPTDAQTPTGAEASAQPHTSNGPGGDSGDGVPGSRTPRKVDQWSAKELRPMANHGMDRALADVGNQFGAYAEAEQRRTRLAVGQAVVASGAATVGYLVWFLRGSSILAGVLTSLPVWRMIDPLAVLPAPRPRRRLWWRRKRNNPVTDPPDFESIFS